MKSFTYLYLLLFLLASCNSSVSNEPFDTPHQSETKLKLKDCIVKASDSKLEIATWNIEQFPKTESTIKELAGIIREMDVDIIAMQEVRNKESLDKLDKLLPEYNSVIMVSGGLNLAYLYKKSEIKIKGNSYGILKDKTYEFAGRTPYVLPIHSNATNLDIILINNHFKATTYKDNTPEKKQKTIERRRTASFLLKQWIDEQHPNDNVVVLGDMNDEITDREEENVFQVFLNDKENYRFADREIALPKNMKYWSYPSFPSHIDHILITNELFDNEESTYTYIFQSCDSDYDAIISDHQPVCLILK